MDFTEQPQPLRIHLVTLHTSVFSKIIYVYNMTFNHILDVAVHIHLARFRSLHLISCLSYKSSCLETLKISCSSMWFRRTARCNKPKGRQNTRFYRVTLLVLTVT
jgi:hypothetical protein